MARAREPRIGRATLAFLGQLERNNNKRWFEAHRAAYEAHVRDASVAFVRDLLPQVQKLSPRFTGEARPVGGSIMRLHRDLRFSKDKTPFRTSLGISFWHEASREEMDAPAFYVHVGPKATFAGGGLWHPPTPVVNQVRKAIAADPQGWRRATRDVEVEGEQLQRVPKPWPQDHPLAQDLRRKGWTWGVPIPRKEVAGPRFPQRVVEAFEQGAPVMAFLTRAAGKRF